MNIEDILALLRSDNLDDVKLGFRMGAKIKIISQVPGIDTCKGGELVADVKPHYTQFMHGLERLWIKYDSSDNDWVEQTIPLYTKEGDYYYALMLTCARNLIFRAKNLEDFELLNNWGEAIEI